MPLLSQDFVHTKGHKLLGVGDEKLLRDSKLTGFALRVRRLAEGTAGSYAKEYYFVWQLPRDADGKQKIRKSELLVKTRDEPVPVACCIAGQRRLGADPLPR